MHNGRAVSVCNYVHIWFWLQHETVAKVFILLNVLMAVLILALLCYIISFY